MIISKCKSLLMKNSYTNKLYLFQCKLKTDYFRNKKQRLIKKRGFKLLQAINKYFQQNDIKYFIDFGTLLGMMREGEFIGHDLDIDIGIIADEKGNNKIVREILKQNGIHLRHEYVYDKKIVEDSFEWKGIKLDICYYQNEASYSKCWLFYELKEKQYIENTKDVVEFHYTQILSTKPLKVKGIEIQIPLNSETFLEEKYGKLWRIPDKNWIYWKAPNAIMCSQMGSVKNH